MARPRVRLLSGAPIASGIDWSKEEEWRNELLGPFRSFIGEDAQTASPVLSSEADVQAQWREVSLTNKPFYETSVVPRYALGLDQTSPRLYSPTVDDHDDFLAHSIAVLDDIESSQIAPGGTAGGDDEEQTTFLTTTSFSDLSNMSSADSALIDLGYTAGRERSLQQVIRSAGPITSIKSLPSAKHILSLRPQTMTTSIICGVISISPAKTVSVRRGGGYEMDVVEMLVGDDTKAGFSISTWLRTVDDSRQAGKPLVKDDLRADLGRLRTGDVVLIERLALATFRDCVFGQSLNRRGTGIRTRFVILSGQQAEHDLLAPEHGGTSKELAAVSRKIDRVKDWADQFVGPAVIRKRKHDGVSGAMDKRGKKAIDKDDLPPDTQ